MVTSPLGLGTGRNGQANDCGRVYGAPAALQVTTENAWRENCTHRSFPLLSRNGWNIPPLTCRLRSPPSGRME